MRDAAPLRECTADNGGFFHKLQHKVPINGETARCTREGVGLKFTGIDPDGLYRLPTILCCNASSPDRKKQDTDRHPGLL